jgi:hypothetical protein
MRKWISLFESLDPIAGLIDSLGLTVEDCDEINHGDCGTFGIVLYRALSARGIDCRIGLLCRSSADDHETFRNATSLYWFHMFIERGGSFYDCDGKVQMEDMIANYGPGWHDAGYAVRAFYFDSEEELFRNIRSSDAINPSLDRIEDMFAKTS